MIPNEILEIIRGFKLAVDPIDIIPVIDDMELQVFLSVWTRLNIFFKEGHSISDPPENDPERWEWLWKCFEVDFGELTERLPADISSSALSLFNRAKANHLIFPDWEASMKRQARQECYDRGKDFQ